MANFHLFFFLHKITDLIRKIAHLLYDIYDLIAFLFINLCHFLMEPDRSINIKLKDDGQGLQLDKIRHKAVDAKKWTAEELSTWSDDKVANLIFESGISTAEKANLTAGRGIGMGIVKQKIDDINGSIQINYKSGDFTEFTIKIPASE